MNTVIDGVDYGPLACLVGNWHGEKGTDVAPTPDGDESIPFFETLMFEAIGSVTNAKTQTLAVLRYHQIVSRKSDNAVFHNETGYWHWDSATGTVMQSLTIPRGVCLIAGGEGKIAAGETIIEVTAEDGSADWGITQSPFMQNKARTLSFNHKIAVNDDQLFYEETTILDIYGKRFDHTDSNTLTR
jgi:hypothetical protein